MKLALTLTPHLITSCPYLPMKSHVEESSATLTRLHSRASPARPPPPYCPSNMPAHSCLRTLAPTTPSAWNVLPRTPSPPSRLCLNATLHVRPPLTAPLLLRSSSCFGFFTWHPYSTYLSEQTPLHIRATEGQDSCPSHPTAGTADVRLRNCCCHTMELQWPWPSHVFIFPTITLELEQALDKHMVIFSEGTATGHSVSQNAGQDCWLWKRFSELSNSVS